MRAFRGVSGLGGWPSLPSVVTVALLVLSAADARAGTWAQALIGYDRDPDGSGATAAGATSFAVSAGVSEVRDEYPLFPYAAATVDAILWSGAKDLDSVGLGLEVGFTWEAVRWLEVEPFVDLRGALFADGDRTGVAAGGGLRLRQRAGAWSFRQWARAAREETAAREFSGSLWSAGLGAGRRIGERWEVSISGWHEQADESTSSDGDESAVGVVRRGGGEGAGPGAAAGPGGPGATGGPPDYELAGDGIDSAGADGGYDGVQIAVERSLGTDSTLFVEARFGRESGGAGDVVGSGSCGVAWRW